jgi:hypothetical protein
MVAGAEVVVGEDMFKADGGAEMEQKQDGGMQSRRPWVWS